MVNAVIALQIPFIITFYRIEREKAFCLGWRHKRKCIFHKKYSIFPLCDIDICFVP